jgi:GNAT superfamily N-acetyltransferase
VELPVTLILEGRPVELRRAAAADLPALVVMLADDALGAARLAAGARGRGLGAAMIGWAIEEARRRGCALVQLTTDKIRAHAHRFYGRLDFVASHEGLKLQLAASS